MLVHLSIRDIVLIESLDLEFSDGLSVLTGETGAGKSILLDALSLCLGARGDGGLVRSGRDGGQVTAVFDLPPDHQVFVHLATQDFAIDGTEGLILRRSQAADGRTRAWINDRPASAGLLREVGQRLVEIHGQHDSRAMVDADTHRSLVDAFGGLEREAAAVATAHRDWRSAETELMKLRARVEAAAKEADFLRAAVEELDELAPAEGEEDELDTARRAMMAAEAIATDLAEAYETISGRGSPLPSLVSLARHLERRREAAPGFLDGAIEALDAAIEQLGTVETELQEAQRRTEFEPSDLEQTEERLFALRAASRKYNIAVADLPDHARELAQQLEDLDAGEERVGRLEVEAAAKREALARLAEDLSRKRRKAGAALAKRVMAELPALKLEQARFEVSIAADPQRVTAAGIDEVEFTVRTNPGSRAGPIMKVASGGELSRFLLALKVTLADRVSTPTLVFDEIDTGVGGAVADAIGVRLARLAEKVQVLSVTHAPQVAARAGSHYLISKGVKRNTTVTDVLGLEGETRREEIARMLAGAEITDEARAAAARLMGVH